MNEPASKSRFTYAEYIERERLSETKHELRDGEIVDRPSCTPEEAGLAANVGAALGNQLRGRACLVYSSDVRLRVLATGLATYPDLTVVRARPELDPEDKDNIVNPIVLVEVLSESTEAYDRGDKFAHYRRIPSLKEYVLVVHWNTQIEVFRRNEDGTWMLNIAEAGQSVKLLSIECELSVDEVYAGPLAEAAVGQSRALWARYRRSVAIGRSTR